MNFSAIFKPDYENCEGVRPFNIYFLRFLFFIVFVFLGKDAWSALLNRNDAWDGNATAAFCMWSAFSLMALLGVFHPLRMLPLMLFEVVYKMIFLVLVSYPLWKANKLAGSLYEDNTYNFLWVVLAFPAVPWKYVLDKYILSRRFV